MGNEMYTKHIRKILETFGPLTRDEVIQAVHNETSRGDHQADTRRRRLVPSDVQVGNILAHKKDFHKVGIKEVMVNKRTVKKTVWGIRGLHEVEEE